MEGKNGMELRDIMAKNDEGSMWWEHSRDKAKRQQSSFGRNNDKIATTFTEH